MTQSWGERLSTTFILADDAANRNRILELDALANTWRERGIPIIQDRPTWISATPSTWPTLGWKEAGAGGPVSRPDRLRQAGIPEDTLLPQV
jgi:hypothetical protein